jgi:hypothetical protein
MFTFDHQGPHQSDIEDVLAEPSKPDVIDCGENNDHWIRVRRSKCSVELVSKVDGSIKSVTVDKHFETIAPSYRLTWQQVGAIRSALKGITPREGPTGM